MSEEIQINVKGPAEIKLQINISTDKTVLELKQAIADKSDVEADRQRLIYSGRVLKDEEPLSTYKIQSSHTIHMVKGAARSGGAASTSTSAQTPQALPTMQTGQNVHDPLTQLNGHQGFGLMAGLNPFSDMGVNPNDPNMLQTMMSSPQFLQQMTSMMSNPAVLDQVIASNPQLQAMGPRVREMFQSEHFRQMIADPQRLQQMMQMAQMLRGGGGVPGMFGDIGGGGGFPAPGVPGGNPAPGTPTTGSTGAPPNPFALLGGLPNAGAGAAGGANANPFGIDPAFMQQMLGGGGAGANAFGGGVSFGGPPAAPADPRPAEERFQVQLQQLQDMGFTNASQNVRALLATGGNVHSAIEYILGGGGL